MIDSITHELRTPLTSIKGAATALLAGGVEQESSHELLSIIDEESDRLNRLVSHDRTKCAQLDAQQVQMHFAPVSVRQLVEEARETCSWVEENHPVKVDVPDTLEIRADGGFLQKVICNLLDNAAKYSKPDMPITISAERRGECIAVSVADRGIGIDSSEQSLIFERFYRARNHNEGTAGTGMGLAISRSIIEAHGGHIDVTSHLQASSYRPSPRRPPPARAADAA